MNRDGRLVLIESLLYTYKHLAIPLVRFKFLFSKRFLIVYSNVSNHTR